VFKTSWNRNAETSLTKPAVEKLA